MATIVERMLARRRTSLLGFLIGFSLWQGARLAQQVSPADGPPAAVFTAAQQTGWLIFARFLILTVILCRWRPTGRLCALPHQGTTQPPGKIVGDRDILYNML